MLITSKATTPEEMRSDIVKYLKYQASINRSRSALAKSKRAIKEGKDKAEILEFVAREIEKIVMVETKS